MQAKSVVASRGDTADITVVLVTYRSAAILSWSLPVLQGHPHVVVVDNASGDETVATAKRLVPHARIIEAGANLGFGRANNLGIAAATTPLVLVLNPDAQMAPDGLQALADAASRWPEAAVIAPVLFDAPGVVGDFYRGPFDRRRRVVRPDQVGWHEPPAGDLCVEFVTGAAMLLRRERLDAVGYFDPWFFLYHEDDEFCERVRRAGLPILVAAQATLVHQVRGSSTPSWRTSWRRSVCRTLSKLYLAQKRSGSAAWQGVAWRIGIGSAVALPFAALAALATLRSERLAHHGGRLWASLRAHEHLRRKHCFEPRD